MATLTLEVPELLVRRLQALAFSQGKSVDELAAEGLDSLVSSAKSRRRILKARRDTGQEALLSDLGWLDGYTGQTIDELLLLEGSEHADRLLAAVEQGVQEKLKTQGPLSYTGVEITVLAVSALQREVNNGGYDQFFRNSSRRFAPGIAAALELIGCRRIANITRRALTALKLPQLNVAAIDRAMSLPDARRDRMLHRCDNSFYKATGLSKRLFRYVKTNQNGIRI